MSGAHLTKASDGAVILGIDVNSEPRLTYSLESLPSLIGERQFKMLCGALGIWDAMVDAKAGRADRFDAGAFFAEAVQRRVIHQRIEASRQAQHLASSSQTGDL